MGQRTLAQKGDNYSVGLAILGWLLGLNTHAFGVKLAGKSDTKIGEHTVDNLLLGWIEKEITNQSNISAIVDTLRKLRGVKRWKAGEGGSASRRWTSLAAVVQGLLHPWQWDRWTAAQAVQHLCLMEERERQTTKKDAMRMREWRLKKKQAELALALANQPPRGDGLDHYRPGGF